MCVCVCMRVTLARSGWFTILNLKYCVITTFRICTRVFIDCTIMTNWRMKTMEVGLLLDILPLRFTNFPPFSFFSLYHSLYYMYVLYLAYYTYFIFPHVSVYVRIINIYYRRLLLLYWNKNSPLHSESNFANDRFVCSQLHAWENERAKRYRRVWNSVARSHFKIKIKLILKLWRNEYLVRCNTCALHTVGKKKKKKCAIDVAQKRQRNIKTRVSTKRDIFAWFMNYSLYVYFVCRRI